MQIGVQALGHEHAGQDRHAESLGLAAELPGDPEHRTSDERRAGPDGVASVDQPPGRRCP